jgi:virginiamycin B lyase
MSLRILIVVLPIVLLPALAAAEAFSGKVTGADGNPIDGALVTFSHGSPPHTVTVFSDPDGSFRTRELGEGPWSVRARRIGWQDLETSEFDAGELALVMNREEDPAAVAAQLPANRWYALLLASIEKEEHREELVRQCTYCHQQGNWATRVQRSEEEWQKVLSLMARMGAGLSPELRAQVPALFNTAYDPATAVPLLTSAMNEPDFAPAPTADVRAAVIEEWQVGHQASMQHDLVVHPDGRVYSVDMMQDQLYRLDATNGEITSWTLPETDLPLGGVFGGRNTPAPPNSNAHLGPHSLQVGPDGRLWITLALGNQLAGFDPASESWTLVDVEEGYYPHTLRFDSRGRIWYTLAASNHVGMLDPTTGEQRHVRLPARDWQQDLALRMMPALLWLNRNFDLGDVSAGEGMSAPIPYGVDVAPDGGIWISQLNEHRIGRIDPDTFELEMIDTPFTGPRRLRFDSKGHLWIPGFSAGLVSRFDTETREFRSWPIPIEPAGSETPYALHVNHETDEVWICGTNSDTLIRFRPETEEWSVYPLPTRVTYTRELDFDERGRVWTSNSNTPTWQIEGAFPRLVRLDPGPAEPVGERADGTKTVAVSGDDRIALSGPEPF